MSSLFTSLKEKAQSAVNSSGLTSHSFGRSDGAESPPPGQSSGVAGIMKSHTFESLHHQLRTFQQQYSSSTTPVQKIITFTKGIAIDYDNVSRDAQSHSKELYTWGQNENDDIKDVTDRLAWLSYVQGQLTGTLATNLNGSRRAFKDLRDAENALAPRRNIRVGLENQIARLEHDQRSDQRSRLQELKVQLRKNEEEDDTAEKDIEILKRKAIRESEQEKWEAIREYAEKLSMVAQAALSVVPSLPPLPPTKNRPYEGTQTTASVRASLQKALDGYSPGNISLILAAPSSADLKHTRSFGETHAKELSRIGLTEPTASGNIPITPPATTSTAPPPQEHPGVSQSPAIPHPSTSPSALSKPIPAPFAASVPSVQSAPSNVASSPTSATISPPLNPANLNQAPAPIPLMSTNPTSPMAAPDPADPSTQVPSVTPTVAETGVPKVAGPEGPGPSSGSLLDKKASSPVRQNPFASLPSQTQPTSSLPTFESAEDEKRRLEREEREKLLHGDTSASSAAPHYESAEDEKKRLEREEREKILQQGGSAPHQPPAKEDDGDLPPYQEF